MAIAQLDGWVGSNAAQDRSGFALVAATTGRIEANVGDNGRAVFAIGNAEGRVDSGGLRKVDNTNVIEWRRSGRNHGGHGADQTERRDRNELADHGQSFRCGDICEQQKSRLVSGAAIA